MSYGHRFALMMAERRAWPRHSPDWQYRTRAAWTYLQMHRGIAPINWTPTPPSYNK